MFVDVQKHYTINHPILEWPKTADSTTPPPPISSILEISVRIIVERWQEFFVEMKPKGSSVSDYVSPSFYLCHYVNQFIENALRTQYRRRRSPFQRCRDHLPFGEGIRQIDEGRGGTVHSLSRNWKIRISYPRIHSGSFLMRSHPQRNS